MTDTPERKARRIIDANLEAAGWLVQSHDDLDLAAGSGIAVREFPMKPGFGTADYVLYVDRMAIGAIEAKPEGTLTGVEEQSEKYAVGLPDDLPAHHRPLPVLFLVDRNKLTRKERLERLDDELSCTANQLDRRRGLGEPDSYRAPAVSRQPSPQASGWMSL